MKTVNDYIWKMRWDKLKYELKEMELFLAILFACAMLSLTLFIPLPVPPPPPAPACKVCHCGQTSCHRECGEENMCNLKCEGLCQKNLEKK